MKKIMSKIGITLIAAFAMTTLSMNNAGACNPELPWDTGCAEYDIVIRPGGFHCIEGGKWKCLDPNPGVENIN